MKMTMRYEFDAFRVNLQCCIFLRLPLGPSDLFFFFFNFESHVDQTEDRPGIRVERQKN